MNDIEAIDFLADLVRIPSPSRGEREAVEYFVRRLAELGFDATIDAVGNAVGTIGACGPRVVLLGHIDTVPGDVPVRLEAGRLHGRGAVDAKGSLVAFAAAAARARAAGTLACRVELVACVEEESVTSRGAHHRATTPAPDACIVGEPSGWDGVTVGYKGFLRARLARDEELAHTAAEAPGAAALACRQWVHLENEARTFDAGRERLFERLLLHLADVSVATDGLTERAELDVRLRLPADLPPQAAEAWLVEHSPGWRVSVAGGLPAWSGPRTSPVARALGRAIATAHAAHDTGGRVRYLHKTGTADLNVVAPAWGCPSVAYGPGDSALDHTPDEYIELEELMRAIRVLQTALGPMGLAKTLAAGDTVPHTVSPVAR